jgi:lysophospholipase L1-like esterase
VLGRRTTIGRACAALLIIVTCAACGPKVPPLPKLNAQDVVLAFGDSLTYGTGAAETESYPAVLQQMIGRPVVRSGVPGEVSAQGLERIDEVLDEIKPRLVIVCLGGNDLLRKVPDEQIASNLRGILRAVKAKGASAVLVGVPRPQLLSAAPEFYAQIAKEFDVPYEGASVKDVLYTAKLKSDPIHPNAAGYRQMAEAIAKLLKQAGAL